MITFRQFIGRVKLQWRGKNHIVGWSMTSAEAIAFIRSRGKTVLTFYGYSGMQYEDEKGMLQIAQNVLSRYSPKTTLVNSGVTSVGVGAIYPLAKSMGFETSGVVTARALKRSDISEAVDHICFIDDRQWGGKLPDSDELSPTSKAMVACSDILVGIGGGEISQDEMLAGKAQGKPVYFYPADHNHELAIRQAKKCGLPPPVSFKGTAHDLFFEGEELALKRSSTITEDMQ